jgi:hypothetical protein
VYVSVSKEALLVKSLLLRIVGEEEAVIYHEGGGHHNEQASVCFLQSEYPLHTFPNKQLPPGQYEYPFAIQLPQSLPSTMGCCKGKSYCEVKYELVATLQRPKSGMFRPNSTAKQQLHLVSAPPLSSNSRAQQQQLHLPLERVTVERFCCYSKGTMALEVKVDRTMVQPHDTVTVQFRCQNQSSVKVSMVRVQLKQIIEWQCQDFHERFQRVLDQRNLDSLQYPELVGSRQQLVAGGRQEQHRYYFGTAPPPNSSSAHDVQPAPMNHDWHASQLKIPPQSQDSWNGRQIQIRHVLSVQLRTKGWCTTNPEVCTRLQVYRSDLPPMTDYRTLPVDWNAQTAEAVVLFEPKVIGSGKRPVSSSVPSSAFGLQYIGI